MQEYLKSVLPSAGTPAASGQDEPCSNWENLKRTLEEIQANMGGMEAEVGRVKAQIAEMAADMVAADDGVRETLDVVVTMLMAVRGEKVDTPHQACIFPGDYAEPHGLTNDLRHPTVWTRKLEEWIDSDLKACGCFWYVPTLKSSFRAGMTAGDTMSSASVSGCAWQLTWQSSRFN